MFNPNDHEPKEQESRFVDRPGNYILVFKKLKERGRSKNGNDWLTMIVEVIGGQPVGQKGRSFQERLFINEKSWWRLGAMFSAMDHHEEVDLTSNASCAKAMLYKPFMGKVKMEENNGELYAGVAFFNNNPDDGDRAVMDLWVSNNADFIEQKLSELDDKIDSSDQGWSENDSGGSGSFADDDIPF